MRAGRGTAAALLVAGLVLLGGPAGAQEDPCAPGPDGEVPVMCQGGAAPEPAPAPAEPAPAPDEQDPCAPGPDGQPPLMCQGGAPVDDGSCAAQPVEPGDGVVTDGGGTVSSDGSTSSGDTVSSDGSTSSPPSGGGSDGSPGTAPGQPEPVAAPEAAGPDGDGVVCAYASAPDTAAAPAVGTAPQQERATVTSLPRTGSQDRLLVLAVVGAALVLTGAGAVAAARRR